MLVQGSSAPLRVENRSLGVLSGVWWVTRQGETRDWLVQAGTCLELPGRGWLVSALESAGTAEAHLAPLDRPRAQGAERVRAPERGPILCGA